MSKSGTATKTRTREKNEEQPEAVAAEAAAETDAPGASGETTGEPAEKAAASDAEAAPQPTPQPQRSAAPASATQLDDTHATASYANFARVSSTPEELILDLGVNPQPFATNGKPVRVDQRIIMNHFTAKRLLQALSMSIHRHEQAFGVLETNVMKRVTRND